jgi:hypothetical protein
MTRRTVTAIATLCPFALLVAAAGCGGAGNVTDMVATGSVSCKTLTGVATFSPPLTSSGSAPETITISLKAGSCATTNSNSTGVTEGRATTTNSTPATSNCNSLFAPRPVEVTVEWTPSTIHSSTVHFTGFASMKNSTGTGSEFVFPDPGGKATGSGSFTGDDGGASSTVTAFSAAQPSQLLAACQNPAGLTSIAIGSGTFRVG